MGAFGKTVSPNFGIKILDDFKIRSGSLCDQAERNFLETIDGDPVEFKNRIISIMGKIKSEFNRVQKNQLDRKNAKSGRR